MEEILTYEEIRDVCVQAVKTGICKVKITGGEPLVRKDAATLIGMLNNVEGIEEVSLTTNGVLLREHLAELIKNGLKSVNISLDTMDRNSYREITGSDDFDKVIEAIHAAVRAGLRVKINTVLLNNQEFKKMLLFARENPVDVRFIELMPIGMAEGMKGISHKEVVEYIEKNYPGSCLDETRRGNGPARYLSIPGFQGKVGFISPIHGKFCHSCNRIRLTATGQMKPCLCYGESFDIRTPLRKRDMDKVFHVIQESVLCKPKAHQFEEKSKVSEKGKMVSIGG